MALTLSTGVTSIDTADSTTNWSSYKITAGGGTPSIASVTDLKKEGTACNGIKPTSSKDCGMVFDYFAANGSTTLNMETSGNEVICLWLRSLISSQVLALASGGLYIVVTGSDGTPSSTTDWAKWYIGGSDANPDGWTWYQVDTRKTPSATGAGWVSGASGSLSTVHRIGVGAFASSATAARVESLLVDEMWYGHPTYKVVGDGTTVATWDDLLSDSTTNVTGLIADENGALSMSCGVQIGDDTQTATTTFDDDTSQAVNWKRHTYHNGTSIVDALTYADYYYLQAKGAASFNTSVTLGNVVGSDAGIVGGTIKSLDATNVPLIVDFETDQAHLSACNLYGVTWDGITGSFQLGANSAFKCYSNQFIGCDQVELGSSTVRNSLFINTASTTGAILWNANIDIQSCQFIANTTGEGIEHDTIIGVIAGTCTSAGSSTVLNSTGNLGSVLVGDYAYNETDGAFADVTDISGAPNSITTSALSGGGSWDNTDAYSISPTVGYTDLTFSGNTSDVTNSATGSDALFVAVDTASNPVNKTGTIEFISSVAVTVTVKDVAGTVISGAQVGVFTTSTGTEVMNDVTNGSGVATAQWTGGSAEVKVWIRQASSGATKYKNFSSIQNITGSGLTLAVTLVEDPNNNATTQEKLNG